MAAALGNEGRTALSNLFWKGLSLSLEKALRWGIVVLAGRALGEAPFGRFQYVATVTTLLALGTDLGLGVWTTRELARDRARATSVVGTVLGVRTLAALPYLLITAAVAYAVGPGEMRAAFLCLGGSALVSAFADHFAAILRGYERMQDEARLNVARAALAAAGSLGALAVWRTLPALAAGMMAGTAA